MMPSATQAAQLEGTFLLGSDTELNGPLRQGIACSSRAVSMNNTYQDVNDGALCHYGSICSSLDTATTIA
jgi:hypothetical protein